ncbi:MAG TPA: nuclear transport factor 2 family protein [Rhodopila sp.]|nr:nuclear transport factor 2 family protein [Rhodopila sp.]
MPRLSVIALLLGIGLMPLAQAQPLSDHEARKAGEAIVENYNKAGRAKDATALANVYTEDAILVMPEGPLVGRTAIADYFKSAFGTFTLEAAQLERATTIANGQVMLRVGSFTGTLSGPEGTRPVKGYWASTDVREGDTWRIRQEEDNVSPASATEATMKR